MRLIKIPIFIISIFAFCFLTPLAAKNLYAENYSSVISSFTFTRDLSIGNRGQDVENLQCILGVDSPTGYFGSITKASLVQFQNDHAADILTPAGLTAGTGYFGSSSRAFINQQLYERGASTTAPTCPIYVPPTGITNPPSIPEPQNFYDTQSSNNTASNMNSGAKVTCPSGFTCTSNSGYGTLPNIPSFNNSNGFNTSPYYSNQNNTPNYSTGGLSPAPTLPGNQYQQNLYATNVNPAELQAFVAQTGWVTKYDKGTPPRLCQVDPVISYLIKKIPSLFPWAYDVSDCRSYEHNLTVSHATYSRHISGEAIDIGSHNTKDSQMPQDEAEQVIIWASHNAGVLGIRQIIYAEKVWFFENGVLVRNGTESDHFDHVHIGR